MKALYKYPINAYPYQMLVEENQRRGKHEPEFEIEDSGVFDNNCYFDVGIEYAKAKPNDILIKFTITNQSSETAELTLLPTLWFRNTWSWEQTREDATKPKVMFSKPNRIETRSTTMGRFFLEACPVNGSTAATEIYTENETNHNPNIQSIINTEPVDLKAKPILRNIVSDEKENKEDNSQYEREFFKDAFHEFIIFNNQSAVNPNRQGTKAAYVYRIKLEPGQTKEIKLRLYSENDKPSDGFANFDEVLELRKNESEEFYRNKIVEDLSEEKYNIVKQAYAGLLWNKQFYFYIVKDWINGDKNQPPPPEGRKKGRNNEWKNIYNRDIISMPDKWEYPWYAAWDLAFHMIPYAKIDQVFAEKQLLLFLKEWYMHPNGKMPAYEFSFSDVNPPVHAWAVWRTYKSSGPYGQRNRPFLEEAFQKLLINFTWWVNQKDKDGKNLFSGGFLGLDNITVFDRSNLPPGVEMVQADGTAWMAFYCITMLKMAMELANKQPIYSGMASKFFEHFMSISAAAHDFGEQGLWDENDGFYYDQLIHNNQTTPLKVRSMVGVIPLFASTILKEEVIMKLPDLEKRMNHLLDDYREVGKHMTFLEAKGDIDSHRYLLALPNKKRLRRVLEYVLDENEFLSEFGIRSLSKYHGEHPFSIKFGEQDNCVNYTPGESTSGLFGGNSNWRGPIWIPLNHLLIESLLRYYEFYEEDFLIECPTRSGNMMNLKDVALDICRRLTNLFIKNQDGIRPFDNNRHKINSDAKWKDLILFYEYFHGEHGKGLGASHQTGWTALIIKSIEYAIKLDD